MVTGPPLLATFLPLIHSLQSPKYPGTRSYIVDTPAKYQLLANDSISSHYDIVVVKASAHQDVLSLPQQYPKSKWPALYFVDGPNHVHLFGKAQALWALFKTRTSASLGLPNTYRTYEIHFDNIAVEIKEIEHILAFELVEKLLIFDQANVIGHLIERIEQLKQLHHLHHLGLSIVPASYAQIDVTVLLTQLPSLKIAHFHASALSDEQFYEFVRKQDVPKGWHLQVNHKWIAYTKNVPLFSWVELPAKQ